MIRRNACINRLAHNMWNGAVKVLTGMLCCRKSVYDGMGIFHCSRTDLLLGRAFLFYPASI